MNVRWIRARNPPFLSYGAKEIDDKKIAKKMAKVDVNKKITGTDHSLFYCLS